MADFSGYLINKDLIPLTRDVAELARTLVADGRRNQAQLVRGAYQRYVVELNRISQQIAQEAEQTIKDNEVSSQVRGHGGQGPSLSDFIGRSEPLQGDPGSVAINDEDWLDANGVGWWWTNEEGFSGHIGRQIQGFFQPSGTFPMAGGGSDPTFVPSRAGGVGEIRNPIPARYFVRDAFQDVSPRWKARVEQATDDLVAACRAAMAVPVP